MDNSRPKFLLTRSSLPDGLAHPRYAKLCRFLDKNHWTHITSEGGMQHGLLHSPVSAADLQREAHSLIRPVDYEYITIEGISPDFECDLPLPQPKGLREWLVGYIQRKPTD